MQENRDNKTKKSNASPNPEYRSQSDDVCITIRPALSNDNEYLYPQRQTDFDASPRVSD